MLSENKGAPAPQPRTSTIETPTRTHIIFDDPNTFNRAFERAGEEEFEDRE